MSEIPSDYSRLEPEPMDTCRQRPSSGYATWLECAVRHARNLYDDGRSVEVFASAELAALLAQVDRLTRERDEALATIERMRQVTLQWYREAVGR